MRNIKMPYKFAEVLLPPFLGLNFILPFAPPVAPPGINTSSNSYTLTVENSADNSESNGSGETSPTYDQPGDGRRMSSFRSSFRLWMITKHPILFALLLVSQTN